MRRAVCLGLLILVGGCREPSCGDGILDPGESCEPDPSSECTPQCELPRCGDGIVQAIEACDDGNLDDGDECPSTCTICGDRVLQGPEMCDDGNDDNLDGCAACMTSGTTVDRLGSTSRCGGFIGEHGGALITTCEGTVSAIDLATDVVAPLFAYSELPSGGGGSDFTFMLADGSLLAITRGGVAPTLTRLSPGADVMWTTPVPASADGREVYLQGAVLRDDGTIVAVGFGRPPSAQADAGFVLQLGGDDGSILHNVVMDELPVFRGLGVAGSGAVLAVGNMALDDGGLVARVQPDMAVVPLYTLGTSGVETGVVGSGATLRALVNPIGMSFSTIPYVASVAIDETGPSPVWRVDLHGGKVRPFGPGMIAMGNDPGDEQGVVRRVDSDTMATVWEERVNGVFDAILATDGFLYLSVSTGMFDREVRRVVW